MTALRAYAAAESETGVTRDTRHKRGGKCGEVPAKERGGP